MHFGLPGCLTCSFFWQPHASKGLQRFAVPLVSHHTWPVCSVWLGVASCGGISTRQRNVPETLLSVSDMVCDGASFYSVFGVWGGGLQVPALLLSPSQLPSHVAAVASLLSTGPTSEPGNFLAVGNSSLSFSLSPPFLLVCACVHVCSLTGRIQVSSGNSFSITLSRQLATGGPVCECSGLLSAPVCGLLVAV